MVSEMTNTRSDGETSRATLPAVFRVGPLLPFVAFVIGFALDYLWPLQGIGSFSRSLRWILAWLTILLGVWFIGAGNAAFRRANAGLRPWRQPRALATSGVYATTRNPLNQGFLILVLSLALLSRSDWTVLLLVPTLAVMHAGVRREERMLGEVFGEAYRAYIDHVPRYGLPFGSTPARAMAVAVVALALVVALIWVVWPKQATWSFGGHQMTHRGGASYAYVLPRPYFAPLTTAKDDAEAYPSRSSLQLFENGVRLGPPHSFPHAQIAYEGRGAYSHWYNTIVFAASDNTNPRTNRRAYEARGWIEPVLLNVGLAILLLVAAAARMLSHMSRQMAKR
jgi:protein-S-isoprenylcysteine O-methyltransferase Ste14